MKGRAGGWVYRLEPNALFALHLEPDPTHGNEAPGYLLHPEHFNLNFINGTKLQFSKITNQSQGDVLVSIDWQDGALRLKEVSPRDPMNEAIFSVRLSDPSHVAFSLSPPFAPLIIEKSLEEPRLSDNWDSSRTYTADDFATDNPRMAEIEVADQADRKDLSHIDWKRIQDADAKRRAETAPGKITKPHSISCRTSSGRSAPSRVTFWACPFTA